MTETFICCICGEVHPLEDRTVVNGLEFCRPCLYEETLLCHECGQRILREDNVGDEDPPCARAATTAITPTAPAAGRCWS